MQKDKTKNEVDVDQHKKYTAESFIEVLKLLERGIPFNQIESKGGLKHIDIY